MAAPTEFSSNATGGLISFHVGFDPETPSESGAGATTPGQNFAKTKIRRVGFI
jgi:hypothetical protein